MKTFKYEYFIGVDEVGRGPLAGPVALGAVLLKSEFVNKNKAWGRGFKDSKKLSAKAREVWLLKIKEAQKEGWLEYAVVFVAPTVIDKKGLSYAIRLAIEKALERLNQAGNLLGSSTPKFPNSKLNIQYSTLVLLDGGLRAPSQYLNQKTIIKGDEKELSIALASIVAKVARDKRMVSLSKKFPQYGFEKHKGYGTLAHYEAIKKHGITPHHRKSFLSSKLDK